MERREYFMTDAINPADLEERKRIGIGTLERYTGSKAEAFQKYILLTNFGLYLDAFKICVGSQIFEGNAMQSSHNPDDGISIIEFGVGSPTAALIIDMLSFIEPEAVIILGLCGGLRQYQKIGDYFLPVAAIRGEGTSDHYLPRQVPSLSNFIIQRYLARELEERNTTYHVGVIHSTNYRFWEFDAAFRERLITEQVQTIDMECATMFTVGYARQVPVGALMLISDKPLEKGGVKTSEMSRKLFKDHAIEHIQIGIDVLKKMKSAGDISQKKGIW